MAHGLKFEEIKVCDNLIIDGHHRYLSSLIMKVELGRVASNSTSATVMIDWALIELEEEDWDARTKLAYLNEQDAKHNDMQIDFVSKITQRELIGVNL